MQVTELESKGLKKSFRIVVEAAQINAQMEAELKAAGEQVKIPGFRPGFIPMKVLKQRYGKAVQGDVIKNAINRATTDAVNERKLRPALMPQINIEDYKDGGDLTYTMTMEALPETPEIDYDKITLDRYTFEVADKEVDEALARIAERSPKLSKREAGAKAKAGDVATIDFKGIIDGVAFEGGSAKNFRLELGAGQFIEGFEDQLIGAKEGDERVVKVTFPKDYPGEQVAGKPAEFEVSIKEIHGKEIPAVDDEFAIAHGFADMPAFRAAAREQLSKEYDQLVRNQLKKALFDVLEEKYDFELPQSMVDIEFKTIWERLKQARGQGDPSVAGKNEEELKKEYEGIAHRRVKLGLMLADIGARNKLQISREELSQAVMRQASQFPGQEKKVIEFYRGNPDRVEDLRGPILEEKAVDFILSKIEFKDKKVTVEELLAMDKEDDEESAPKEKASKAKSSKKKESHDNE